MGVLFCITIIWLPFGIVTFIANIGMMLVCFVSIIFIPVGIVLAKSCTFLLWPVGAKVITKEEAETIRMERSMMKVAGTAMAVNAQMIQNVMPAQQSVQPSITTTAQTGNVVTTEAAQPNQTLENLKEGSAQVLGSIKETGGKAATAIAVTSATGLAALKSRQKATTEQVLAKEKAVTAEDLLTQTEVKLYHNKVMAWVMPFLEYITIVIAVMAIIVGVVRFHHMGGFNYGFARVLLTGIFYGIVSAAPIMLFVAVLGMLKQNHIFVLVILGVELLAHFLLGCLGFRFDILGIICYLGMLVWYVLTFVKKIDFSAMKPEKKVASLIGNVQTTNVFDATTMTTEVANANVASTSGKNFCSRCGEEVPENVSFCPKCGNKLR